MVRSSQAEAVIAESREFVLYRPMNQLATSGTKLDEKKCGQFKVSQDKVSSIVLNLLQSVWI